MSKLRFEELDIPRITCDVFSKEWDEVIGYILFNPELASFEFKHIVVDFSLTTTIQAEILAEMKRLEEERKA